MTVSGQPLPAFDPAMQNQKVQLLEDRERVAIAERGPVALMRLPVGGQALDPMSGVMVTVMPEAWYVAREAEQVERARAAIDVEQDGTKVIIAQIEGRRPGVAEQLTSARVEYAKLPAPKSEVECAMRRAKRAAIGRLEDELDRIDTDTAIHRAAIREMRARKAAVTARPIWRPVTLIAELDLAAWEAQERVRAQSAMQEPNESPRVRVISTAPDNAE